VLQMELSVPWLSALRTYSSDYETHGAYYGAKKGCEPLHIQINNNDRNVLVINTTLKTYENLAVSATLFNELGEELHKQKMTTAVGANSKTLENAVLGAKGEYEFLDGKVKGKLVLKNSSHILALSLKLNLRSSASGERVRSPISLFHFGRRL
jgi:hypothetical protein